MNANELEEKARFFNVEIFDLRKPGFVPDLEMFTAETAWRFRVIPLWCKDGIGAVVMEDPADIDTRDTLIHLFAKQSLSVYVATTEDIEWALSTWFSEGEEAGTKARQAYFKFMEE